MTCDQASNLMSARIDGELAAGEGVALDAHLAGCAACRAEAEATEVQDAALLRAFAPRREVAAALADRVARDVAPEALPAGPVPTAGIRRRPIHWAGLAGAVAAGVVLAVLVPRPAARRPGGTRPPAAALPVARMTLATGEVFACPADGQAWRPMSRGDAVTAGERVRTTDASKCELQWADGARMRLNASTEACFADRRAVRLASGQVWSAVPPEAAAIRVTAGPASVAAGRQGEAPGAPGATGTQFDLACAADKATVTVLQGEARVVGSGGPATVCGGKSLDVPADARVPGSACVPVADPLGATRWQDELLVLKAGDDPEVAARVGQLLARISAERAGPAATAPGPVEEDVRARGQAWSGPLACYVCGRPTTAPTGDRRTAARLLADLAPAWCIPDLIELLGDEEGEVRYCAASALRRLTGQDAGYAPARCAAGRDPAAVAAWRGWWRANKARYSLSR